MASLLLGCGVRNDNPIDKANLKAKNLTCRLAALYHYALEGLLVGIWSCFLPDIQTNLNLTDTELGSAVLFFYAGSVIVNPISAYAINNIGGATATFIGATIMLCMLPMIAFASTFGGLIATFLFLGMGLGLMDTSMNSLAILAELVSESTIMGSFHGSYSIAAAVGSLIGGALVESKRPMLLLFGAFSAVALCITIFAFVVQYSLLEQKFINANYKEVSAFTSSNGENDDMKEQLLETPLSNGKTEDDYNNSNSSKKMSPRMVLYVLGFVGFLAAFGESGLVTWVIVYYTRYLPFATGIYSSLGFTAFQTFMAIGRYSSDFLRIRYGRIILIKLSGIFTAIGSILVVFVPALYHIDPENDGHHIDHTYSQAQKSGSMGLVTLGFALVGCGLSYLIPIAMSTVGELPTTDGNTIAILNSLMYCGSIVSSPALGAISDSLHSLKYALMVNAAFMLLISPCGWGVPQEKYTVKKKSEYGAI